MNLKTWFFEPSNTIFLEIKRLFLMQIKCYFKISKIDGDVALIKNIYFFEIRFFFVEYHICGLSEIYFSIEIKFFYGNEIRNLMKTNIYAAFAYALYIDGMNEFTLAYT